ncbi:MAG: TIR domain-containing protein [Reyranella sp.]|uniref:nSTAND1 domain-containing NTPase n=1 Tax=Reyranella sp. TaxID=1929291 RepID=UPI003D125002
MGGFDVFFSYHWRDHASVEAVARALTGRGLSVFLDRWYMVPGQPWPQALERTLASCKSVAVFLGVEGLGSWQQRESDLALDRQGREPGFPVIPVLLTRADPALGFLRLNTWVDLSANIADETALEILCAAIRGQPPVSAGVQKSAAVRAAICPYRGLRWFREEDAAFFCGREAFTDKLVETVDRSSLVAVVGASGIGKSSVVRAGLIPRLRRKTAGGRVWEIATLVPSDRPLHSLAAAFVPLLEPQMTRVERLAEINKLAEHFADGSVALCDVVADALKTQPGTDRLLLFVDQWEELYTLTADDGARRRFLAEILDASSRGPVTVVLTLRGDFFGQALSDRSFADRLQGAQVNLGPMTPQELERSITEPAEKVGLHFESGLVDRLLDDVGDEPGSLPLLEFVLAALWEQRRGNTLHHDAYEHMGGVQGAIAARADAEYEKLSAEQKDAARRMLLQMVRPGEKTEDTRQRAVLPVGNETALSVIRRLADARLVVTTRDPASGVDTAEVTHEALIRHWTLLRRWVDQDREFLRCKARLETAAVLWEADKRDASRLLPGGRPLAEGKTLLASRRSDLGASVIAFIEASAAADAQMRRRRLLTRAAALAAGLLLLVGGLVVWDFYFRDHARHYNAYAKRWGAFEGVGAVHPDDVAHRARTFRIVRQGRLGPVVRMDVVDGSGNCAARGMSDAVGMDVPGSWDSPMRVCSVVWERDSKDRVIRQTLHATNRVVFSLEYPGTKGGLTADFRAESGLLFQFGSLGLTATTINYERFEDGPNRGLEKLERYTNADGEPKRFFGGAYGHRTERGSDGLIVSVVSLGRSDKPMRTEAGFTEMRVRRDEAARPVEFSLFDENGRPVRGPQGVARWVLTYDTRGNQVREEYFDETGHPTLNNEGYAAMTLAYGPGGAELERAYLDEAGQPTLNKKGHARLVMERDQRGRRTKSAFFDLANQPVLSSDGYASAVRKYDESGNIMEISYFDRDGKPTRSKEGYAKFTAAYGDHRLATEFAYFDPAGKPTLSKNGYAKKILVHDQRHNVREEAYFDERGKATRSKEGCAKVVKDYDSAGRVVEEACLDEQANPTLSNERYAKALTDYDREGEKVRVAYFDAEGKPTVAKAGYASIAFVHSAQGRVVRESYYDKDRNPVRLADGYAGTMKTHDPRGNLVEQEYFDEAGKPTLSAEGYAKIVTSFDSNNKGVGYAYYDTAGNPTVTRSGYASIAVELDPRGNIIRVIYRDENGKRTRSNEKYSERRAKFGTQDKIVDEAYFDEMGKPISVDGYHRIKLVYDARGNKIETRVFDDKSQPARTASGYARVILTFDERDNQIREEYFDEAGKPIASGDGYAGWRAKFDRHDNAVEYVYFDSDGAAAPNKYGYAIRVNEYDSLGRVVVMRFLDPERRPVMNTAGRSIVRTIYDKRGLRIEERCFDTDDKPVNRRDDGGWSVKQWHYDSNGRLVKTLLLDAAGQPI